jgi:hypothetical protein
MEPVNQVRGHHFMLGVFKRQQNDPFCCTCSAFANTLRAARESLAKLEGEHAVVLTALSPDLVAHLAETRRGLASLQDPPNPSGQKKAGNCKLPQGVCFVKASFALIQQI